MKNKKIPVGIITAIIGAVAIITVAFIGLAVPFIEHWLNDQNSPQELEYIGRVMDNNSLQPIAGAKVSLDLTGVPSTVYADSQGVYVFKLALKSDISGQVRVDAQGYQTYIQNITISPQIQTIGDFRLMSLSSTPATQVPATATASGSGSTFKVGMVTDTGGINDKSFNALSWQGVQDAQTQLGVQGNYLESKQPSDYPKNIQQFINEGDQLIITVGFLTSVDIAKAARADPNTDFAIVDYGYPDCFTGQVEGKDCGSFTTLPNLRGLGFQTDQAGLLAGYLAAGMSKTGKVGTFGGLNIPTVTDFMKGFEAGVKYYDTKHNTHVQLLGWSSAGSFGMFTNNFISTDDGRKFAQTLQQEGADIILPVAGGLGFGSAAYCQETKSCLVIGVDSDWFVAAPEYRSVELSSIQKKVNAAVFSTIRDVANGKFVGGNETYGLRDGAVDLAPYHDFDSQVPKSLKDEIAQTKQDIINGTFTVDGILNSN
jgi:basic membrane protein A and related proteins